MTTALSEQTKRLVYETYRHAYHRLARSVDQAMNGQPIDDYLIMLAQIGISQIPTDNFDKGIHRYISLYREIFNLDFTRALAMATWQEHRIEEIVTWQDSLFTETLLTLALGVANDDIPHLMRKDTHVILWRGQKILRDGNHRYWLLRRKGVEKIHAWTVTL